jgi:hypothetical protein
VQPRIVLAGKAAHVCDRVKMASVHLASVRDHDRRRASEALQLALETLEIEATRFVGAAVPDLVTADSEHRERLQ